MATGEIGIRMSANNCTLTGIATPTRIPSNPPERLTMIASLQGGGVSQQRDWEQNGIEPYYRLAKILLLFVKCADHLNLQVVETDPLVWTGARAAVHALGELIGEERGSGSKSDVPLVQE